MTDDQIILSIAGGAGIVSLAAIAYDHPVWAAIAGVVFGMCSGVLLFLYMGDFHMVRSYKLNEEERHG